MERLDSFAFRRRGVVDEDVLGTSLDVSLSVLRDSVPVSGESVTVPGAVSAGFGEVSVADLSTASIPGVETACPISVSDTELNPANPNPSKNPSLSPSIRGMLSLGAGDRGGGGDDEGDTECDGETNGDSVKDSLLLLLPLSLPLSLSLPP